MYEELLKAYSAGADRYWLLNVGDIKPMEIEIQHFFDMAYDFGSFNYDNVNRYQAEWLAKVFGSSLVAQFQFILDNYYRLAWDRKPEFMGYEYEWSVGRRTGCTTPIFRLPPAVPRSDWRTIELSAMSMTPLSARLQRSIVRLSSKCWAMPFIPPIR